MKPPSSKETQVVWSGSLASASPQRAEILEPTAGGGYAVTGQGGTAAPSAPKRKAAKPAPSQTARAAKTAPVPATPEDQSRVLAETVVGTLVGRLKAEAKRNGGVLRLDDIEKLSADFQKKTEALQGVFQKSFEEYVKARERASWEQARQYPFDRILVKTFSHLFADGPKLINDMNALSRRVLPGFFMAMGMMLGPNVLESYQERCRAIVKRYKDKRGDHFAWGEVYEDPAAAAVLLDAQVAVAPYFADLERRLSWFVNMVNGHLAPYDGDPKALAARWQMTDVSFYALLDALFADLKGALNSKDGNKALVEAHGQETCSDLYAIFREIEAAARAARDAARD